MKIRVFQQLEDDVYRVIVRTEDWSQLDLELMAKFGEPEIDVGGEFDGVDEGSTGSGDPIDLLPDVTFTLDSKLYGIKTGTDFVREFDLRDFADAEDRALLWKGVIINRITSAIETLRAQADDFTKEEVTTV